MANKASESHEIVGLITSGQNVKKKDPSYDEETNSSNKRKRKSVQRIGAVLDFDDPLLSDEEPLDLDRDSSDAEFTPSTDKESCVCKKQLKNGFVVRCHTCQGIYHGNCIGIDRSYYEAISLAGDVWLCPICASLDTGIDIDVYLSRAPPHQSNSPKSQDENVEKSKNECDSSTQSIEIIETGEDIHPNGQQLKDPLSIVDFNESDILKKLSNKVPPDTSDCGDYHLFTDPNYVPKLNECLSFISKAKSKDISLCYSPPSKNDIKGGYIYVFKSEMDLLENLTNEGEWSIGDGYVFTSIVMKKYPITSSKISIFERLESNSDSNFKRRAVWLSSDPSTIVVGYIGTNHSVDKDKDVELVILEDESHSLNEPRPASPMVSNISKALLSLPPGISVVPQSEVMESNNVTPKKKVIEVVDLSSDDNETPRVSSSTKKRKKRMQFTPKRKMPNLPPKQSEYLKYRRNLSVNDSDYNKQTNGEPSLSESPCSLKISHVQSLTETCD